MKKLALFIFFAYLFNGLVAQSYWQQEVNYHIHVTLDDNAHTLTGDISIEYTNNSPNELDTIWMHLWGNAFKNNNTEFAKQQLRNGSTEFYFADEKGLGYYKGLDFSIYGQKLNWAFDKKNPDIAALQLAQPLRSGGKIIIKTPFTLKIPASWSRLGHVGTSYQMTQWYPKPAVYDAEGWHPMPYLDMGEFYSEFGNFEVEITLPDNYVVGATGVLETASEKDFLEQKVAETQAFIKNGFPKTDDFPASSTKLKTLRYTAEKVHDFAWFADKRFHVVKDEAVLPSGKKIPTWGMFTNSEAKIWTEGAKYVRRAVEFYSQHVGEYPWPQATAVHSALSAGGGMEYPMITVIGNSGNARSLDDVITHEVGHNWFYGLLATNERDHPWMDEGLNSYYEHRYMRQYYGSRGSFGLPHFIQKHVDGDIYETGIVLQCRRRLDQAPESHSNDFSQLNYGLMVYMKTASVMYHLEQYLGTATFDRIMKKYYERWHFKHPQPTDFRSVMERESGKDLAWFFDGFINSTAQMDYCLNAVWEDNASGNLNVSVTNKGSVIAPFPIVAYKDGTVVHTQWYDGFKGEAVLSFLATDCDRLVLDGEHATLEVYRKNNSFKPQGVFNKVEPLKLHFTVGTVLENSKETAINLIPAIGRNVYDGHMLGVVTHNGIVPSRRFQYQWTALYGTKSGDLVGTANVQYNIFPKSERIKQLSIGVRSKAFNYSYLDSLRTDIGYASTRLQYRTITPYIRLETMHASNSKRYGVVQLRSILLQEENTLFEDTDTLGQVFTGTDWVDGAIHELSYELGDRRALNPWSIRIALEQRDFDDPFNSKLKRNYLKLSFEGNAALTYANKRNIYARVFVGRFLKNDYEKRGIVGPGAFNLTGQGFNDYRYDDYYFGRTEYTGFYSQQIHQRDGGMKVPLGGPYSEGRSNSFMFAVNLKADLPKDLPLKLPLKPYFDFGYYDDARPISNDLEFADQVWWQGGIALEFDQGALGVYLPIVNSKTLKGTDNMPGLYDTSGRDKFLERIAFTIDLNRLNPWKIADSFR